jgi:FtsH-binding integral membrane protein
MNPWNRQDAAVAQSQARAVDQGLRSHMLRIYNYMTSGVLLTAVVAYFAGTSDAFKQLLLTASADGTVTLSPLAWIITFAPLAMVFFIGFKARSMSAQTLMITFFGYATLMGLSLFSIFWVYTEASIFRVLLITAGTFGALSIYGYSTKRDLTSIGSFLIVGVWAMLIVSLVNVFLLKSSGLDLALSYVGVLLALGLTAYDTQKAKEMYYAVAHAGAEEQKRVSIFGALSLYFDFIYLFIHLLRIVGDRR